MKWIKASERMNSDISKEVYLKGCRETKGILRLETRPHQPEKFIVLYYFDGISYRELSAWTLSHKDLEHIEWLDESESVGVGKSAEWREVPVSERLPIREKRNGMFSIVVPVCIDGDIFCIAFYDYTTAKWWNNDKQGHELYNVTHWLEKSSPLPLQEQPGNDLQRLYEWLIYENREQANTFFTSGELRNVAKEIEYRLFSKTQSPQQPIKSKERKANLEYINVRNSYNKYIGLLAEELYQFRKLAKEIHAWATEGSLEKKQRALDRLETEVYQLSITPESSEIIDARKKLAESLAAMEEYRTQPSSPALEEMAEAEVEKQGWGKYEGTAEQNGIKNAFIAGYNSK